MAIKDRFVSEIGHEAIATRQMLERIPAEDFDWKPHERSMTMKTLAGLVADMFGWFSFMLDQDELDFAKGYDRPDPKTTQELVEFFDRKFDEGMESLKNAGDEVFSQNWKLRNGDQIYMDTSKLAVVRQTVSHMVHHRGQLSVFMRLRDIPLPPIYGPTADENVM
jgi:uncharacterized damage-inducible protein DinB